jgi:hypothetical protein
MSSVSEDLELPPERSEGHSDTTSPRARLIAAGHHAFREVQALRSFPGLTLVICLVLCAGPNSLVPQTGVDSGWVTGLNIAKANGLRFGRDLLFTYGPWGYLDAPLGLKRSTIVLSIAFTAFGVTVCWHALRCVLGKVLDANRAALAAAVIIVYTIPGAGGSALLVLGATLMLIDYVGTLAPPSKPWLPAVSAVLAALLVEVKFPEGVFLFLAVVSASLFAPAARVRRCVEVVLAFVVALPAFWLLAGQSVSDLPRWFSRSIDIARGFSDAMQTDYPPNDLSYLLIIAFLLTLAVFAIRMYPTHGLRRALGVFFTSSAVVYLGYREATGRHDGGHEVFFFMWALTALVWYFAIGRSRLFRGSVVVLAVILAYNNGAHSNLGIDRGRWSVAVETLTDPDYPQYRLSTAMNDAQAQYQLSDQMQDTLADRPMSIDGAEVTLAWAYGLHWRPAPVFQSYTAYTASLDEVNANWLIDSPDTQMILRPTQTGIDYRNSLWDSPRYVLAEMCHLKVNSADAKWLLLEMAGDRCGSSSVVSSVHVAANQTVPVPQVGPSQILTMSFSADPPSLITKIGRTLNKGFTPLLATADGGSYRLPRALADGPLIASVPSAVGWPAAFGGTTSYRNVSFTESGTITFKVMDYK